VTVQRGGAIFGAFGQVAVSVRVDVRPILKGKERRMAGEHVEQREGCFYVVGTRISLDSIVYAFREGCSPESIREDFNGLTLADLYGAIAYYLDHQTEVDSYLLRRKAQWAELESQGSLPSGDLAVRLERARGNGTVPPQ
jgi:uncharacterized protein (DUF433 family)